MKRIFPITILLILLMVSCEEEELNTGLLPGFWSQESVSENGTDVTGSCESSTRLLIEQNGIYRLYSDCDTMDRSGTWLITADSILNLSMDRWNGSNKYEPYPVRFTILDLNDLTLEIRIKTFIGDRKKLVMFTPVEQDTLEGLTNEEFLELDRTNKTLVTYVYRFTR